MKKKSILIKEFYHKELVIISKAFGVPYGDLVQSMILYFKRTGINPVEAINENPATMVKALDKRIVSFLKVQERDILKPLRSEVYQQSSEQKEQFSILLEWVKDAIIKINQLDSERTKNLTKELDKVKSELDRLQSKIRKQQDAFVEIATLIDTKNKSGIKGALKSIFE
ncbi:BfmA/BtgA family mobilization protein [Formosa sp. PL04]|uniref:BfmA/BtgA family mobilization protein n=1 Tax=Formosa sp. PL04 TaxID=3081755 RepID=UPI002980DEC5|nr:BfmA/BtgA family mobilization protein [Formosa sp. PL04]MDW5288861.1 BfmA/BtgA family mobilization protein [Formosa sp. PL04]